MRKIAFTMAEVLITLGIIGVVAAMTLPALVQNSRNRELRTSLSKANSVILQALNMYQAENGERATPDNIPRYQLKKYIIKYFKISRDCGQGSEGTTAELDKTCIPNYINEGTSENSSKNYKTLNGKAYINLQYFDDGQFVLADGMLVLIENGNTLDVTISVDLNGYRKRPNRLGQDLFMFELDKNGKLLPMGVEGSRYYSENDEYCSLSSTNNMNGAGCTYKALSDPKYFDNLPK